MGSICKFGMHEKDQEYRAVTVPESLKPTTFYIKDSPIESEYSSVNMLSLPSISHNSSFQSTSTPKSSNLMKSNKIRLYLANEALSKMSQCSKTP